MADARTAWAAPDADELALVEDELRAMLMNVQTEIDERVLAARADWAQVQAIWQRAGGHVPTQERARAWQHAVLFFRWLFAPALNPAWPRGRRARG